MRLEPENLFLNHKQNTAFVNQFIYESNIERN